MADAPGVIASERTRDYLTRSAFLSLAITGVVVATALLVGYLFRRFDAFLERRYRARLEVLGGQARGPADV